MGKRKEEKRQKGLEINNRLGNTEKREKNEIESEKKRKKEGKKRCCIFRTSALYFWNKSDEGSFETKMYGFETNKKSNEKKMNRFFVFFVSEKFE